MLVKKQQVEPDMEQQIGSKLGKEYVKAAYWHFAYLTSMQSTSCKMLGWMKHKQESRLLGEIAITSDMQMTSLGFSRQEHWSGVGCHFRLQCMKVKSESEVTQSCLTRSDPMD